MKDKPALMKFVGVLFLILAIVVAGLLLKSKATDVTSSLTIANTPPNALTNIGETIASTDLSPTNEGVSVTISGTATDDNGDSWTLLVCQTAGVAGTSCAGTAWCTSGTAASGASNSCSITTTGITTEDNPWYAYACDVSDCSVVSQGDFSGGDSGKNSPFVVNHAPTFTVNNDGPKDPGSLLTFTASVTDTDVYTSQDMVTLDICKEASWTEIGGCGGTGAWCTSGSKDPTAGPVTCDITLASVLPDGNYDYYAYLKDSHNFASSSADQGAAKTYTVNNVAPSVSGISILNYDSNPGVLSLDTSKAGTTTPGYTVHFTVTDNNSCTLKAGTGDEIIAANTKANFRESSKAQGSCSAGGDADTDDCYPQITCSQDGGSCTGISDPTATFTCTFALNYNANPTIGGPYDADNWIASVKAVDNDSADSGLVDGSGLNGSENELNQFLAFAVKQSGGLVDLTQINYGTMSPNAVTADGSSPNSWVVGQGNTGLDQKLNGTDMTCTVGGCSGQIIPVSSQKYGSAAIFDYNASTDILSILATPYQYCAKPTSAVGNPNISTFWKIKVPSGKPVGNYTGTDTIVGAVSDGTTHAW
ncbi:MAG TPA: hypothetical protein P5096_02425 [Patescibacteria group bacterium]|nr:hypothetical protein [Patescibacteria group bacterium]